MKHSCSVVAVGILATMCHAQSVRVDLVSDTTSLPPGGMIAIGVEAAFDTAGGGVGVFGGSGLHGFGGNLIVSGTAVPNITVTSTTVSPQFFFGATASVGVPPQVLRAAGGRRFDGGLTASPSEIMGIEIEVDADATIGETVEVTFEGAVVLAVDQSLLTWSTDPGSNQSPLSVGGLVIRIGAGGCNVADVAAPLGTLDIDDVLTFLGAFSAGDPIADVSADFGVLDIDDVLLFLIEFDAGCP